MTTLSNGFVLPEAKLADLRFQPDKADPNKLVAEANGVGAYIEPKGKHFMSSICPDLKTPHLTLTTIHFTLEEAKLDLRRRVQHVVEGRMLGHSESIVMSRFHTQNDNAPPFSTPWGPVQTFTKLADNIFQVSTAGHGGIKMVGPAQRSMPAHLKLKGGWYEEDSEATRVVLAHPELFSSLAYSAAEEGLRHMEPEIWEQHFGLKLGPQDSRKLGEIAFTEENKDNWVVISALTDAEDKSKVNVIAAKGGIRSTWEHDVEEAKFVVDADEYSQRGRFGFVIDESRHQRQDAEAPARPRM